MELNNASIIGGVASLGVIAVFWQKTREWIIKVFRLFFEQSTISNSNLVKAIAYNLVKNYKSVKITRREFEGLWDYVRPKSKTECVAVETPPSEATLWYNVSLRHFIYLSLAGSDEITITYFRRTFNIDLFIIKSLELFNGNRESQGGNWRKNNNRNEKPPEGGLSFRICSWLTVHFFCVLFLYESHQSN